MGRGVRARYLSYTRPEDVLEAERPVVASEVTKVTAGGYA